MWSSHTKLNLSGNKRLDTYFLLKFNIGFVILIYQDNKVIRSIHSEDKIITIVIKLLI